MPRVLAIFRTERPSCAKRWISKMVRWSIMVCSQRVADELPDGGRIGLGHLLRVAKRCDRWAHGMGWVGEHLKEVAIKRDKVLLDECIAGEEILIEREL